MPTISAIVVPQRHAHRHAREDDAADKRRDGRSGFDHVGDGTRQLAAEAEALRQPQEHDDKACGKAPRGIGRDDADAERGGGGHEDRREEHAAAPELIAEAAEHEAAERTGEVSDCERRERHHEGHERILAGKERAADLRREDAEDHEVVVLERAAEARE